MDVVGDDEDDDEETGEGVKGGLGKRAPRRRALDA